MINKRVKTSLEEDMKSFGVGIVSESKQDESSEKQVSSPEEDETSNKEDILESEYVSDELFDRIMALEIEEIEESDFEDLMEALNRKKIPDGNKGLAKRAEEVVIALKEGAANRIRRFKAGKTSKKVSFQCPQGMRQMGGGEGGRPRCVPAHRAAGGMGKLNMAARKKKKWAKSGKGTISKMKSGRVERRRGSMRHEDFSPLAIELMQITEGVNDNQVYNIRESVIDRICSIMCLLAEELNDVTVTNVYSDVLEEMHESYAAGRLSEDVLEEDEFIQNIQVPLSLITRSLNRLESGESGNE